MTNNQSFIPQDKKNRRTKKVTPKKMRKCVNKRIGFKPPFEKRVYKSIFKPK